jgi:transcriptional regulator with XRE-family HTH domain
MGKIDEDIGARLTAARQMRGLSREDVSRQLGDGFALPTVQAHENGRNALRPSVILRYIEIYDIDAFWLLSGRGSPDGDVLRARELLEALSTQDRAAWIAIGERLAGPSIKSGNT